MTEKLKSFTIAELLVVLIITSILSISLYYAFLALSQMLFSYEKNQEEIHEIDSFYAKMKTDIDASQTMLLRGNTLTLALSDKTVYYSINSRNIQRRNPSGIDELEANILAKSFLSQNEINNGSSVLIDQVKLKLEYKSRIFNWAFSKEYDAFHKLQFYQTR